MLVVVVPTVLEDDRRSGPFRGRRVVKARHADGIKCAVHFRDFRTPEGFNPAGFAEQVVDRFSPKLVIGQAVIALRQVKIIDRDKRFPEAAFGANRAIAFARFAREIDCGFEANGTAMATPVIGLFHHYSPAWNV